VSGLGPEVVFSVGFERGHGPKNFVCVGSGLMKTWLVSIFSKIQTIFALGARNTSHDAEDFLKISPQQQIFFFEEERNCVNSYRFWAFPD